jgi:hypothetical protein
MKYILDTHAFALGFKKQSPIKCGSKRDVSKSRNIINFNDLNFLLIFILHWRIFIYRIF